MEQVLQFATFDYDQKLPGIGLRLPARMSVLTLSDGQLALVSPIPIDDAMAAKIASLGEVRFLIAPNLLHHLYLTDAIARYPQARVLAPRGLAAKLPKLRIDTELEGELPRELTATVDVLAIAGAPGVDEFVFFHRPTHTLVVTDLVFNVRRPQGWAAHVVLFLGGCHGKLAQSRLWRFAIKERAVATRSVEQVLALPTHTLVMAHGEIVHDDAQAQLAHALRWLLKPRLAVPAVV